MQCERHGWTRSGRHNSVDQFQVLSFKGSGGAWMVGGFRAVGCEPHRQSVGSGSDAGRGLCSRPPWLPQPNLPPPFRGRIQPRNFPDTMFLTTAPPYRGLAVGHRGRAESSLSGEIRVNPTIKFLKGPAYGRRPFFVCDIQLKICRRKEGEVSDQIRVNPTTFLFVMKQPKSTKRPIKMRIIGLNQAGLAGEKHPERDEA